MRNSPPFRADHVGSLLRPPALLEARKALQTGNMKADQLRAIEDKAVHDAVKLQEHVGLRSITDGEFRRSSWLVDFLYQVGGVARNKDTANVRFFNAGGTVDYTIDTLAVTGKLHLADTIFGKDFRFLKSVTTGTPKLTIPSPSMMHFRSGRGGIDPSVYPDPDAYWHDLAEVYAAEIAALSRLGCTYLQLDDMRLGYINDPKQREGIANAGGDPRQQHLLYIKRFNDAVAARPAEMTIAIHLCRGNFRSSWQASGGYDFVAEALFNDLDVDAYFLEYDDDRSGGFEPLRFVPKGKMVVLGLVTTKSPALESKDDIKRRLDAASKFVPLDQICLSPQCGFSSTVDGNALTLEQQTAKLRLVVEIAEELWGN
jgi:5-methyltetrahydropteroyltriglutamate--homocysteine methyltransferase